jgi:hypothetical protein
MEQLLNMLLQISAGNRTFLDRGDFLGGRDQNHHTMERPAVIPARLPPQCVFATFFILMD